MTEHEEPPVFGPFFETEDEAVAYGEDRLGREAGDEGLRSFVIEHHFVRDDA